MAEVGADGDPQSEIKLFTMNGGVKWYLRAHAFGNSAELVCPDHLNHVSAHDIIIHYIIKLNVLYNVMNIY